MRRSWKKNALLGESPFSPDQRLQCCHPAQVPTLFVSLVITPHLAFTWTRKQTDHLSPVRMSTRILYPLSIPRSKILPLVLEPHASVYQTSSSSKTHRAGILLPNVALSSQYIVEAQQLHLATIAIGPARFVKNIRDIKRGDISGVYRRMYGDSADNS